MFNRIFGCFIGFNSAPGAGGGGRDDKKTTHVGNEEDHFTDGTKKRMIYIVNAAVASAHMSYILRDKV